MAIKVKKEELLLEQELSEKLKEFGLVFEMPEDEEEIELNEEETDEE